MSLRYVIISILPKGRSFSENSGTKSAVLPEGRSSTTNSGTKVAVLLVMNRWGSFPLISAPYSLFSIWTDLKTSEKIPGAPARRWGEWICVTGPSILHRNSSQGLNIRAHSPTFPSLHLRHNSFSNPFVALPTSQLILQPFRCFTYVTALFPTLIFASPTSQALHLRHLASRPWPMVSNTEADAWQSYSPGLKQCVGVKKQKT